jgi:hypothetical protein
MRLFWLVLACFSVPLFSLHADSDVYLLDVPDYTWFAGCFGTATGNLMGYWDRHGMTEVYTGPTGDGLAPMDNFGANVGIRSMWASRAGLDGRPANQPGHIDDYWIFYSSDQSFSYQSTDADPYVTAGRAEHTPDCIGDFIGLSQRKWTNMNNECDGNVDAFSFVYWDTNGNKRVNFTPPVKPGTPARDIQSGLREWAKYRGYAADVFTQLTDFNPQTPPGAGFTFADLKAEIDAGYPLMVFLQDYEEKSRPLGTMPRANPEIHGMLIYGYEEYPDFGFNYVYCRTSWGSGGAPRSYSWGPDAWVPLGGGIDLAPRGVIGFRPKPRIRSIQRTGNELRIDWDGPSSQVRDAVAGTTTTVHRYVVERSATIDGPRTPVGPSTTDRTITVSDLSGDSAFFVVRLATAGE